MEELPLNFRKGTERILLNSKVLFLAKWMKTEDAFLIKQIFIEDLIYARYDLMLAGRTQQTKTPFSWAQTLVREDENK